MAAQLPGNALLIAKKFGSLNTKADRSAIGDDEFSWIENWMPLGDGNLRTLAGEGTTLYTAGGGHTISYYFPYNIGATAYIAVFLSDFSAVQVQISNGATTTIGSGLFSANGLPACSQWGSKYLLITAPLSSKNAYWIWDGSILYGSGTLAPVVTLTNPGNNYASSPTVTAYGGSGSGATFSATRDPATGEIATVVITNPGSGYLATDHPVLGFSGGGSDTTAILTPGVDQTSAGVAYCQVTAGGHGYSAATYITFSAGPGSTATGVLQMVNGVIIGVTVTYPGSGYTSPPTITITDPAGTPGTGGAINAVIHAGQVVGATITVAGTNYSASPTVTITGDGTGAAAHCTLTAGAVTAVVMESPGLGYTWAKMEVSGGNRAAAAEVTIMPFGVSGTTIETYQSRVWIANGINSVFTGPASLSDFATSDGGGAFQATDSHLRVSLVRYAATSSFLYGFGDSSINVIANVQSSGSPLTTTFSNDNVDNQVGAAWRDTVVSFGRAIVFANTSGVYALYGGAAEKVSDALDGLFQNADFNTLTPTAAVATIYSIRVYMLLFRTTDPFGVTRNILAMWNGQKWWVGSQVATLTQVALQEVNSSLTAWGCDGTHIYPLFQTPTTSLTKKWQSKLVDEPGLFYSKQANRAYLHAKNNDSGGTASLSIAVDYVVDDGTYHDGNATATTIAASGRKIARWNPGTTGPTSSGTIGVLLGMTGTTTSKDVTMITAQSIYIKDYKENA
jgi:hypothetical protein